MTYFYDAANPSMIPQGATHAALYYDGIYGAAGKGAAWRFAHRRWITDNWDYVHCGIVDYEPGNPSFSNPHALPVFVDGRNSMKKPHRVYCDRANAASALKQLNDRETLWWIATLDGLDWTPETLSENLRAHWNADIPADHIWGIQNMGDGTYDRSNLELDW